MGGRNRKAGPAVGRAAAVGITLALLVGGGAVQAAASGRNGAGAPTPAVWVVAGGESVGATIVTRGLIVSGLRRHLAGPNPARVAGIRPGQVLWAADGRPLHSIAQLYRAAARDGRRHRPLRLAVEVAPHRMREYWLQPLATAPDRWRLGLKLEQEVAGVGTLSFWDPSDYRYVAFGHSLTDGVSVPVGVRRGMLRSARVVGIRPADAAHPGEKIGQLDPPRQAGIVGWVGHNGPLGISGRLLRAPAGPQPTLPLATPTEVHPGPARLLTVLQGERPVTIPVVILRTFAQAAPAPKGILFQIRDPAEIARYGGVVEGMSGSPLLQDGRVVGAVTHVLVNRPTVGYGCYAYWLAAAAGWPLPAT